MCLSAVPGSRGGGGVPGHAHLRGGGEAAENGRCDPRPACSRRETASRHTSPPATISSCAVPAHCRLPLHCNLHLTRRTRTQAPLVRSSSLWFFSFAVLSPLFSQWWSWVLCFRANCFACQRGSQINLPRPLPPALCPRPCACQPGEIGRPELPVAAFRKKGTIPTWAGRGCGWSHCLFLLVSYLSAGVTGS